MKNKSTLFWVLRAVFVIMILVGVIMACLSRYDSFKSEYIDSSSTDETSMSSSAGSVLL